MSEHKNPNKKRVVDTTPPPDAAEKLKAAKIPTRRVKILMVNPGDFIMLFTKGLEFRKRTKIIEGIPEDAKLLTIAGDSRRDGIQFVIESREFDPVPINVLPPLIPVSIQTLFGATKKKASKRKK